MAMHPLEKTEAQKYCDSIKLSEFNQIQSYGVLLVLDNSLHIIQCSENVSALLETTVQEVLNQPISKFLISENTEGDIINWLDQVNNSFDRMLWQSKKRQLPILATISKYSGQIFLEIELNITSDTITAFDLSKYIIADMEVSNCQSIQELCQIAANGIKKITGYHRVLIYKFDQHDQSGIVVGQALDDGMDSYFGLRFPATDIPQPVRSMYLTQPFRYIPDISSENIKIVPEQNSATDTYLDLSCINLRMIVPIHMKYLSNMKIKATSSIALILDKKLWGLIVFHHKETKFLSLNDRRRLLFIAKNLSTQLLALESATKLSEELRASELETILSSHASEVDSLDSMIEKCHNDIMRLVSATGMSVCFGNKIMNYGNTPSNEQILGLMKWLEGSNLSKIYATSKLPLEHAASLNYRDKACGLLALQMIAMGQAYLMLYKPERTQTISWAGNPKKTLTFHQLSYSPRDTFERFQEHIANTSTIWTERQIKSANFIQSILTKRQLHDSLKSQIQTEKLATVTTLAAGVAHEINNPLAYVISNMDFFAKRMVTFQKMLDLLESLTESIHSGQTEKIKKACDEIASFSKANKLAKQFSDVKDLLKESMEGLLKIKSIVSDMKSLIIQPDDNEQMVDINSCVKFAIANVLDHTKSKFILHQHYSDLVPINGNCLQMQTVFTHLFKNAVQAIGDKGEISVSTAVDNEDIVITFTDNGCGIKPEDLKNIFAPFFTLKPVGGGRGLGLTLVYRIVKLHGGSIMAKSEPGSGSVFIVRLPNA